MFYIIYKTSEFAIYDIYISYIIYMISYIGHKISDKINKISILCKIGIIYYMRYLI